ncbi:hypothetical protein BG011_002817 [Mortierella polycephala]|uniref:Uncharacterized protein n=1 Tax=Mortierella polycephala TaxID=41804 RepID=A0A9P6Q5X4_9FUNG|nr:hypothetical protein BG011_002817 [Mortierella polycephala]
MWAGLSTSPGDMDGVDEFTINAPEYGYEADISSYISRQRHTIYANEYTARPNLSSHRYGRNSETPRSGTKYSSTRSTQPGSSSQRNGMPLTSRNRQSIGALIPRYSMPAVTSRHNRDHGRDADRAFDHEMTQEEEQYRRDMDFCINGHDQGLENHHNRAGIEFQTQQEIHRYMCSMADTQRQATLSRDNSQDLDEDVFHDFDSSSSESKYSFAVEEPIEIPRSPSPNSPTIPPPKMALKPPPAMIFASSPVSVPKKKTSSPAVCAAASSSATSASSKTTNTDPKRHSNATSRGSARRIIYSADVEQGLPEGHIAREGKFEIVPSNRLSNSSSRVTGNRSSQLRGRGVTAVLDTGTDYEESTVVVRTDRKGKSRAIAVAEDNNQVTHGRNKKSLYGLDDLEEQEQEQHLTSIHQGEDPCETEYKVEADVDIMAMAARADTNIAELEAAVKARAESEDKAEVEKTKRHSVEGDTLTAKTDDDFSKDCADPPLSSFSLPTRPRMRDGNVNDGSPWSTGLDAYDTNQIGICSMFLHAASSSVQNLVVPRIIGFLYHGEPRMMNKAKKLRSPAHQSQKSGELKSSMRGCQNQIRLGGQEGSPNVVTPLTQSRQPVKMQSLLKAVERYSWPPAAASSSNLPRSSEPGDCEDGTTQRPISMPSHYHFSAFPWTNPLDFPLHPQECDRPKLHWDTSSESTTETRRYGTTAAASTRVEDPIPPLASVLIMGMTGAELIDSVKFENDHPGSLGYYGPLEFDRDEGNRRLKTIVEQEKQKEDKKRKRAAAWEKSPWVRKCRSFAPNFFLGHNVAHDSRRPSVSGAEESPTLSLGNRGGATAGTVSGSLVNRIQSPIRNEAIAFVDTPNPEPASLLSDENKKQELGGQMNE